MHIQYTYNHGGAIMKDNNFVNLGKRIREKRLSQNLTQEALAEKADVGTTHISHIETGCTKLSLTTFISIAEYYGAAEPPVRCGESHLSGLTEPPHFVY